MLMRESGQNQLFANLGGLVDAFIGSGVKCMEKRHTPKRTDAYQPEVCYLPTPMMVPKQIF
jgi:hypothetical protein